MSLVDARLAQSRQEYPQISFSGEAFYEKDVLTTTQTTALKLLSMEISVFPLPFASKGPKVVCAVDGIERAYSMRWKSCTRNRLPVESAVQLFRGRCNIAAVAGAISGNLVFLDCETRDALDTYKSLLHELRIPLFVVRSGGRKRGGHIYLRIREGEVKNIPLSANVLPDTEVKGNRGYVLAANSVHPETGAEYQWEELETDTPPIISIKDFERILQRYGKEIPTNLLLTCTSKSASVFRMDGQDERFGRLSSLTKAFIQNGALKGERNNRLFKAACDMYGCGYSAEEIRRLTGAQVVASGLSDEEVDRTIDSACSHPRQGARSFYHALSSEPRQDNYRLQQRQKLVEIATSLEHTIEWTGRGAIQDRALFRAAVYRMWVSGFIGATCPNHLLFRASYREFSEHAHCGLGTVKRGIDRLIEKKLLRRVGNDAESQATLWRFGDAVYEFAETNRMDPALMEHYKLPFFGESPNVPLTQGGDERERGALGYAGYLIHRVLLNYGQPATASEIGNMTNLSLSTVKYHLRNDKWLRKGGMVTFDGTRYSASVLTEQELRERVLDPSKRAGKSENRRERYKEQRSERLAQEIHRWRSKYDYANYLGTGNAAQHH